MLVESIIIQKGFHHLNFDLQWGEYLALVAIVFFLCGVWKLGVLEILGETNTTFLVFGFVFPSDIGKIQGEGGKMKKEFILFCIMLTIDLMRTQLNKYRWKKERKIISLWYPWQRLGRNRLTWHWSWHKKLNGID